MRATGRYGTKGRRAHRPVIQDEELTAQQWFERALASGDLDEELRFYNEAIRLKPDYANAFYNRGNAHRDKGDVESALQDYDEAIHLKPTTRTSSTTALSSGRNRVKI